MGTHGAAGTRPRALPPGNHPDEPAEAESAPRRPLLNLSDWPVSRRLFTVIVAALLMGLIFGGLRVADAEASASQFSQVSQQANLGQQLTVLVDDLQNERDATLTLLSGSGTSAQQVALTTLQGLTTTDAMTVHQAAGNIGSGFPANIQADAANVVADTSTTSIDLLHQTLSSFQDEDATLGDYAADINDMIDLGALVDQGASDASLTSDVQALNGLALAKEEASEQRGLVNFAFGDPEVGASDVAFNNPNAANVTAVVHDQFIVPAGEEALSAAYDQEFVDEAAFQASATPAEATFFSAALGAGQRAAGVALVENFEQNLLGNDDAMMVPKSATSTQPGSPLLTSAAGLTAPGGGTISTLAQTEAAWQAGTTGKLDAMQSTEQLIAGNIAARAGQLHHNAEQTALLYGIITALVLLLVLLAAVLVARSLVLPLRRLRAGALNIASVQLPERVKMLSESPETAGSMEVAPIDVVSEDEIGQVARAFDQVHAEAVRLAGEQALLRSSFNAMFVNLSRRSQSLIERLARTIDTLEQTEEDPDRLGSLFAMDHMVTRMRRNSENLLLLAGHENPRKWSDSIPLADVARAATSEIEQYNRVTLNIPPGIAVIGQAVSDVVHLIAELVENATIFSPKDTQVLLTMQELSSGGVLIEILDKGIGVSEARLTDMNFRLDNPPTIDVSVSRHMGLFAVARLAERHRVRVRLRPAAPQGLSALVWLPESVIERTGRYSSVQSWSTQAAGSPSIAGSRSGPTPGNGVEMALDEGSGAPAQIGFSGAGSGYGGNGLAGAGNGFAGNGGAGNGNGGNGYGGNGFAGNGFGLGPGAGGTPTGREGREARTASGWFRGPLAGGGLGSGGGPTFAGGPAAGSGPATGPLAVGGAIPFSSGASAPEPPVRRVPGESLVGSPYDQTATGLPLRGGRGGSQSSVTPAAAPTASDGPASPPGPSGSSGTGPQALPTRGTDPSRSVHSRGPVPRGPGGNGHALPQRSPDQARSRLAGFQRGTRRAEERPGSAGQSPAPGQLGQAPGAGEGNER